jgi:outer membrane protein OmpU
MKKTFKLAAVSSAALVLAVAPAMADGHPTLKLGGYFDQKISVTNNENRVNVKDGVDVREDAEVYVMGSASLDNGIKIKTMVQFETDGNKNVGDIVDETYMLITGGFGAIKMGAADHAPKSMTTGLQGMWATNVGENATFNTNELISNGVNVESRGVADQLSVVNDAEMISYTSPRMGGFQIAAGYSQNDIQDEDARVADNAGTEDIVSFSAIYSGKFGGSAVNIGGGIMSGDQAGAGVDDAQEWIVGANVTVGAYKIAASYSRAESQETNGVETAPEFNTIELGLRATMGATTYSISYATSEADSTIAADDGDKLETIVLAMRHSLGKGVKWHNTLYSHEASNGGPEIADSGNDGYAFTTGIEVRF